MVPVTLAEYGNCPCGGVYEKRLVEVNAAVDGEPRILSDVPQGECPECGSRVYKVVTLEEIEAFVRGRPLPLPSGRV
jgi:YgiT-type zinc finger domain-containing protein